MWIVGLIAALSAAIAQAPQPVRVVIQTEIGEVELDVDTVHAPVTAANFLKYVDAALYDGGQFHRTVRPDNQQDKPVRIAVIQAAANADRRSDFSAAIPMERTSVTGLRHKDGTLSMARAGVDTATHSFFICVGDQPELDFGGKRNPDGQGFAAFGRVVRGMDVVKKIQAAPAEGETLTPPIRILRVRRVTMERGPVASRRWRRDTVVVNFQKNMPDRYKVQFTVSRETYEKLRRAQDLLRHTIPGGDPAAVFDRALTLRLADLEKTKLAATERPRATRASSPGSRHVPAAVRREVWARRRTDPGLRRSSKRSWGCSVRGTLRAWSCRRARSAGSCGPSTTRRSCPACRPV